MDSLHLTLDFPPMSHGGISTAVGALVCLLKTHGRSVGVITYDNWRPKSFLNADVSVERNHGVWRVRAPQSARAVVEEEDFGEVQRVVVHHPLLWRDGMTLAKRLKAPIDFVVHVDILHVAEVTGRILAPHHQDIQNEIISQATRVITLSRDVQDRWKQTYLGTSICRAPLPLLVHSEMPSYEDPEVILTLGRFDFVKGTDILIECMSSLLKERPNLRWTHLGGNPASLKTQRRWLRKFEGVLGTSEQSRFSFVPWEGPGGVEAHYRKAGLVLVPSRYETFGLVAREALSFGVGVVAFAVGGLKDILVDDCTGRLIEEVSVKALCLGVEGALEALRDNPHVWRQSCLEQAAKLEAEAVTTWLSLMQT